MKKRMKTDEDIEVSSGLQHVSRLLSSTLRVLNLSDNRPVASVSPIEALGISERRAFWKKDSRSWEEFVRPSAVVNLWGYPISVILSIYIYIYEKHIININSTRYI